jgi:hypothetical protein
MLKKNESISGFTWKSLFALTVAIFLFIPVNMYAYFITGTVFGSVTVFFLTILFSQLSRLFGKSLTLQETLILYYAAGWGGAAVPIYYAGIVYRTYFIKSPFGLSYGINGIPLAKWVPPWMAPTYNSPALLNRTLFQTEMIVPLLVWTIWSVLGLFTTISISLICENIFVERLKYPFPYAAIDSSLAIFLSERPPQIAKYFMTAFVIGIAFGLVAYLPQSFGFQLIPVPYLDFTWAVQEVLPGGVLGLYTVLSTYVTGMIVPFDVATYAFIASTVIWIFLNSLFVTTFTNVSPKWAAEYIKGMGLISVQNRSWLRVWLPFQVGFMLAAAAYLILFKSRKPLFAVFSELFRSIGKREERTSELPSLRFSFFLYIVSTLSSAFFFWWFVPEIPLWVPIFYSVALNLFLGILQTSTLGVTGQIANIPFAWYWVALVYQTSYQGYSGFNFLPHPYDSSGAGFSQQVTVAYHLNTKTSDLLKVWIIGALLALFSGLISLNFLWSIAPIPSSAYPFTIYNCLQTAYADALIVTRQLEFTFKTIVIPAVLVFLILITGEFISLRTKWAFSSLGIILGLFLDLPTAISIFVGSLLSKFLFSRIFKKELREIVGYLIAGELSGEGLIMMIGVGLSLLYKSSWLWPW